MNIKDVKLPSDFDKVGDMLSYMVREQTEHARAYLLIEAPFRATTDFPVELDDPKGQVVLKDLTYRVVEELSEATNCLKMKPWTQTHILTDRDHFLEELSDALHFFLELLLHAGLTTAEDIFRLYLLKSEVNKFRRETGY